VKKLFKVSLITLLLAITLVTMGAGAVIAAPSDIKMSITITGLEQGEEATLTISHEGTVTAEDPLFVQTIKNNGEKSLTLDIGTNLKDGFYQLLLEAPEKYFRDPKGYFFAVSNSNIVNPRGNSVIFNLIPPSAQMYKIYRGPTSTTSGNDIYMSEVFRSLSAPERIIQGGGAILSTGYHYFGPMTYQDNYGVWGRFDVVNPGVIHDGTKNQFAVDRVMARNDAGNKWIEIGWAEVSWQGDTRYMYEYDTYTSQWDLDALPTGTTLEVLVELYSGTSWGAFYKNSSGNLILMGGAYKDIGLSIAERAENLGEVYTNYASHPSFDTATTDKSKIATSLYTFYDWTDSYSTYEWANSPYGATYTTKYTNFDIYKNP